MRHRAQVDYFSQDNLPKEVGRALWKIRLEYFELGEAVSPIEDWSRFWRNVTDGERRTVVIKDDAGVPQGFFVNAYDVLEVDGQKALCMSTKYTYMRPSHRGHPAFMTSGFRLYGQTLARYGLIPTYIVGVTFPNSYAFVHSTFGKIWTLQELDCPAFERRLLLRYAKTKVDGFDEARGLVRHLNTPPRITEGVRRSKALLAYLQKYERLNPSWGEGWAMPLIGRIDHRSVYCALRRTARRVFRTRRLKR